MIDPQIPMGDPIMTLQVYGDGRRCVLRVTSGPEVSAHDTAAIAAHIVVQMGEIIENVAKRMESIGQANEGNALRMVFRNALMNAKVESIREDVTLRYREGRES